MEKKLVPNLYVDLKASTTSSLYIDSTLVNPNIKRILQGVASLVYSRISGCDKICDQIFNHPDLRCFSIEHYISENPTMFSEDEIKFWRAKPTKNDVYKYIKCLYTHADFSHECCVIFAVYVGRVQYLTGMPLHVKNWRLLVLVALLIAQKVWDDKWTPNEVFVNFFPFLAAGKLNLLEMKFLELIQYNITVKAGVYAKFYYELQRLSKQKVEELHVKPLDKYKAQLLEIRSATYKTIFMETVKGKLNKTAGPATCISLGRAVLP